MSWIYVEERGETAMTPHDRHASAAAGASGCGGGGWRRRLRRRRRRLRRRLLRQRAPARGTAFVRPRFFGGMLLTEDDLQAIDDYVLAKRRLTNRSVFGAGVVCGLDVTCDPCDARLGGRRPGLRARLLRQRHRRRAAPRQVDVLALVRELRGRIGVDCGEPCDDQPGRELRAQRRLRRAADRPGRAVRRGRLRDRRLRVLPGPRGLPLRAELRRARAGAERDRRAARMPQTIDDDGVKRTPQAMARLVAARDDPGRGAGRAEATAAGRRPRPTSRSSEEFDELDGDDAELEPGPGRWSRRADGARWPATRRSRGQERGPSIGLNAGPAQADAQPRTQPWPAGCWRRPSCQALPEAERAAGAVRLLNTADEQQDLGAAQPSATGLLAGRAATTRRDAEEATSGTRPRLQSRVLRGLADSGRAGCREYRDVAALQVRPRSTTTRPGEVQRPRPRHFVSVLVRCLCDAANPPCPTCTDARVPIATGAGARAATSSRSATLERHWVHSPRALAYWFPVVEAVRELLREAVLPRRLRRRRGRRPLSPRRGEVVREREVDAAPRRSRARLVRPPEERARPAHDCWRRSATSSSTVAGGPPVAAAAAASRVAALERQVAELGQAVERSRREAARGSHDHRRPIFAGRRDPGGRRPERRWRRRRATGTPGTPGTCTRPGSASGLELVGTSPTHDDRRAGLRRRHADRRVRRRRHRAGAGGRGRPAALAGPVPRRQPEPAPVGAGPRPSRVWHPVFVRGLDAAAGRRARPGQLRQRHRRRGGVEELVEVEFGRPGDSDLDQPVPPPDCRAG